MSRFTDSNASIVTLLAVDSADSIIFPPGTTYSTIDYRDLLPNLERGKGQIISDFEVMARTETNGEVWTKIRAASLAVVPLFIRGQLIGSLNLVSDKKNAFLEDHLDIAREVADRLAVAMQNAQYFD